VDEPAGSTKIAARFLDVAAQPRGVWPTLRFLTSSDHCNNIVITMKALPVTVRRIGNSLGIVIPKPVLAQVGLSEHAELTVERGAIVLRKPRKAARTGWSQAAKSVSAQGEDELLMGNFPNVADLELEW
jgi:antitoxin MazE